VTASALRSLRVLLPLVPRREKQRFFLLLALSFIAAAAELVLTGLVGLLAATFGSPEAVLNNSPLREFQEHSGISFGGDPRWLAMGLLGCVFLAVLARNILNVFQQRISAAFSEGVGAAARIRIFRFYQRAPFLWILRNGVADLSFGLSCSSQLAPTLGLAITAFSGILMLAMLLAGLILVSPVPSLMFSLALGLGGALVVRITRGYLDRCSAEAYEADYATSKVAHLSLHGLKEMRMYRREDNLFRVFAGHMDRLVRARTRQKTLLRLPVSSLEILGFATLVAVMFFLVCVQEAGMARISGIMGFMAAAAWRGLPVANRLVDALSDLRGMLPYLHKAASLIALEKNMAGQLLPLGAEPQTVSFADSVRFEGITFRYPGAPAAALEDVSFTVKKGSMLGLVGLSGAGKSTLVNVLTGLLPPDRGRLLVDGLEISRDNARAWLGRIGYVPQSPYILDASLAENVALSRWGEAMDRERVLDCCRMAALDFLDELEQGMDTVLGDRGTRLSGGQAQRVAIARALYSEPELLIFDEATSSLDMKNEKAIHETILSLPAQITVVIIAHRLSSVEGCDLLVWLDKGKIAHMGAVKSVMPRYQEVLARTPE
jgi:ABC-type multidrug transport system fused ATPase/permease subunit